MTVVVVALFVAMLAGIVFRPFDVHEAWFTVGCAALMLALGRVEPGAAFAAIMDARDVLLFLLSLLILAALLGRSGFFEWSALHCARPSRSRAQLFRNLFVLGAVVTAALSLDTTAVMLTPVVLVVARRSNIPAAPLVIACAVVANVGSLAFPISNLTNLIIANAFQVSFVAFASHMLVPQLVALIVAYFVLGFVLRRELVGEIAVPLPAPRTVVASAGYFNAAIGVLALVLVGYFIAPLLRVEPYAIAFAGDAILIAFGVVTGRLGARDLREISWGVFPFVIGMFVAMRGVESLGAHGALAVVGDHGSPALVIAASAGVANLINNLPAALLVKAALVAGHPPPAMPYAAVIGLGAGPLVMPFASLATILVIGIARRAGVEIPQRRLILLGLILVPLVLSGAGLALYVGT